MSLQQRMKNSAGIRAVAQVLLHVLLRTNFRVVTLTVRR
jgi:hypothetical protein